MILFRNRPYPIHYRGNKIGFVEVGQKSLIQSKYQQYQLVSEDICQYVPISRHRYWRGLKTKNKAERSVEIAYENQPKNYSESCKNQKRKELGQRERERVVGLAFFFPIFLFLL